MSVNMRVNLLITTWLLTNTALTLNLKILMLYLCTSKIKMTSKEFISTVFLVKREIWRMKSIATSSKFKKLILQMKPNLMTLTQNNVTITKNTKTITNNYLLTLTINEVNLMKLTRDLRRLKHA